MYKKCIDSITGEDSPCVKRLVDDAFIPFDKDNTDYQEYLVWLAEGNTPEPWNPEETE
jgi:hypothetical protein